VKEGTSEENDSEVEDEQNGKGRPQGRASFASHIPS
jgi:hypothetical protein